MSYLNASFRTPYWGSKTPNEFKYIQKVFNSRISNISLTEACYRDLLKSNLKFYNLSTCFFNFNLKLSFLIWKI